MKGTILDFSIQKNEGVISGDDNGRYTFNGSEWRPSELPVRGMRVDFEVRGTAAAEIYRELTKTTIAEVHDDVGELKLDGLPEYYKKEFKQIYDSKESYKGKWNWDAFLWGPFWALSKGAWQSAVIALAICIFTGGAAYFLYWFVWGVRGNYIYYTLHVKKKQLPV